MTFDIDEDSKFQTGAVLEAKATNIATELHEETGATCRTSAINFPTGPKAKKAN
jgi:hypothetical protein